MILIDKCRIICYYTGVNKIDSQIELRKKGSDHKNCDAVSDLHEIHFPAG